MTDDRSIALLRAADPVAPTSGDGRSASSEALLTRILTDPVRPDADTPRRHPSRRLLVGAAVAAFVLALTALPASRLLGDLLPGGGVAQAATPPLLAVAHAPREGGAADRLQEIADRVAGLPDDVGTGGGVRIDYRTWSLFTRIDGIDVRSRVVPQEITRALDPDGSGTLTTTVVRDDGSEQVATTAIQDDAVQSLPTSFQQMEAVLAQRNPIGPASRFNAVVETLLERPAGPASRAAILRYLAQTPGLASVGVVEDRIGRTGEGFTVESDDSGLPTRYLLVVDPDSGSVLGYEEMLTRDAGRLDVAIPSVIQYIVWEKSLYTDGE